MNSVICALCGEREATTREHVPPKAIFPRPRPSDLITVPACFQCNNQSSAADESFMVHLGMHVWQEDQALRTLDHNTKLKNQILSNIKSARILDSNNDLMGEVHLGKWDNESHSIIIEKCVRGLYFHHFGEILDKSSEVKTHFYNSITPELLNISKNWTSNSIGNGKFIYKYTSATQGNITMSVWLFEFFGAHWAGGQSKQERLASNA